MRVMRRWLMVAVTGSILMGLGIGGLLARVSMSPPPAAIEVVVFEAPACRYCTLFRETLAQRYANSTTFAAAPMRFVDATRDTKDPDGLSVPISIVPTIVVMRDGRELDRLEGYPAPEALFQMVRTWLATQ